MRCDLIFYPCVGALLLLLMLRLLRFWHVDKAAPAVPKPPRRKRDPKPFAGYTLKPECELCEHGVEARPQMPGAPPPHMTCPRGRPRQVETTGHFCPQTTCSYHGQVGGGNIRATGPSNSRQWRPLVCQSCHGYFLEPHGTPFHAQQVDPDKLVWTMAALAAGIGIRAGARGFETAPKTVLNWLGEAADHLERFSRYPLHWLHVEPVQMDELVALLSAVTDGEVTEAQAIKRLSRSPHWVWEAMDPVCKLLVGVAVGERGAAMAQRLGHHVTHVLAPECAPRFLTDGFREYLTARVTHDGQGMQPERRQAQGPRPKPRWMPPPQLLSAQVVQSYRRRRIAGVQHRVVLGTAEPIESILATRGGKINTAFIERVTLDFRQHVAAIGRRVNTLGKHEAGLRQQLPCSRRTTIVACLTPAYASPYPQSRGSRRRE